MIHLNKFLLSSKVDVQFFLFKFRCLKEKYCYFYNNTGCISRSTQYHDSPLLAVWGIWRKNNEMHETF